MATWGCTGIVIVVALMASACAGSGPAGPTAAPQGPTVSSHLDVLEAGATTVQNHAPAEALSIYLSGFHPLKQTPSHQFEAHHFCNQVNADFMQCALFDGNSADARLSGIEYIISEALFEQLPEQEQAYWHPHNGEILSGLLVAPGILEQADHALMRSKMNSYGKTWYTWDTRADGESSLPLGEPALAWSFNRLGEAQPELVHRRERRMNIDRAERQRDRRDLVELANPQAGVDALKEAFPGITEPIPGVIDQQRTEDSKKNH